MRTAQAVDKASKGKPSALVIIVATLVVVGLLAWWFMGPSEADTGEAAESTETSSS